VVAIATVALARGEAAIMSMKVAEKLSKKAAAKAAEAAAVDEVAAGRAGGAA